MARDHIDGLYLNSVEVEEETRERLQRVRLWLLAESNLPWREPVMMQSGMAALLQEHWPEAVEGFLRHVLAQDNVGCLYDEHEARRYFANYVRTSKPPGRELQQRLASLHAMGAAENSINPETSNELWK